MSGYRNYVPWNKSPNSSSSYSAPTSKKETTSTPAKYDTSFGKKKDDDKRIGSKYGAYGSGYQRDSSTSSSYSNRLKPTLDKKDASHPPVSYRGLSRTAPRSRDPSPDKSSSSSSYNYSRLYPGRPYARSTSRELEPPTTIPKYSGRSSLNKDDVISRRSSISREDLNSASKYGGRSSITKDDVVSKYSGRSSITKDDVPKYTGRSSITKDDLVSKYGGRSSITKDDYKYKPSSRTTSREDLSSSSGSQKYITSRFLPKNTIEKSYTAYTRPSAIRSHETIRKNRELLNVLHAQQEQERSRPTSRCSSVTPDDHVIRSPPPLTPPEEEPPVEMETVSTVTRGTSPTPTSTNIARSRRTDIAKTVEKQITRPKVRTGVDKEVQSDRMDDSTKSSRFSGASRMAATPWSSFLDMKFSSPNDKNARKGDSSPKSISRTNSTKSLSQEKKSPPKTKPSPPKQSLPPQIPKSDSSKSASLHSINATNKDFRKSVLNMSTEANAKKKMGRRSNSGSSAESEPDVQPSEATDVSENLTSCTSYHKSSSPASKLPQRVSGDKMSVRSRRSPSSDASTSSSSAGEEEKKGDLKVGTSRTSIVVSSADELPVDKAPKPPPSPRVKSEAEAKSFLMRALAPVTNLFKTTKLPDPPSDKANWMDSTPSDTVPNATPPSDKSKSEPKPTKTFKTIDSGERAWWLEDTSASQSLPLDTAPAATPPGDKSKSETKPAKPFKRIESGERAWWFEDTSASQSLPLDSEKSKTNKSKSFLRNVSSGEIPWWLDKSAEVPEGVQTYPEESKVKIFRVGSDSTDPSTNIMDAEYQERHRIRHIDSGERSWWLSSAENIPEMVQAQETSEKPKYAIRHQESGDKAWWLKSNSHSEEQDFAVLGDRASPEGVEMPKENEGRLSPYDNVPSQGSGGRKKPEKLFISRHRNIDEILGGGAMWSPLMERIFEYQTGEEKCIEVDAKEVRIHEGTPQRGVIQPNRIDNIGAFPKTFAPYGKVSNLLFNDPSPFAF